MVYVWCKEYLLLLYITSINTYQKSYKSQLNNKNKTKRIYSPLVKRQLSRHLQHGRTKLSLFIGRKADIIAITQLFTNNLSNFSYAKQPHTSTTVSIFLLIQSNSEHICLCTRFSTSNIKRRHILSPKAFNILNIHSVLLTR